jgi:hypothetical protein
VERSHEKNKEASHFYAETTISTNKIENRPKLSEFGLKRMTSAGFEPAPMKTGA